MVCGRILENDDVGEENYTLFYGYRNDFFTILSFVIVGNRWKEERLKWNEIACLANSLRTYLEYVAVQLQKLPVDISRVQFSWWHIILFLREKIPSEI